MCRYGLGTYKPHLACFSCRKGFKRRIARDFGVVVEEQPPRCPECGGPVADMGFDFRPPRRDDARSWKLVESLYSLDFTFHSCGCSGPGYRPSSPADFKAFLAARREQYEGYLRSWESTVPDARVTAETRRAAMIKWRDRIQTIQEKLDAL